MCEGFFFRGLQSAHTSHTQLSNEVSPILVMANTPRWIVHEDWESHFSHTFKMVRADVEDNRVHSQEYSPSCLRSWAAQAQRLVNVSSKTPNKITSLFLTCLQI